MKSFELDGILVVFYFSLPDLSSEFILHNILKLFNTHSYTRIMVQTIQQYFSKSSSWYVLYWSTNISKYYITLLNLATDKQSRLIFIGVAYYPILPRCLLFCTIYLHIYLYISVMTSSSIITLIFLCTFSIISYAILFHFSILWYYPILSGHFFPLIFCIFSNTNPDISKIWNRPFSIYISIVTTLSNRYCYCFQTASNI